MKKATTDYPSSVPSWHSPQRFEEKLSQHGQCEDNLSVSCSDTADQTTGTRGPDTSTVSIILLILIVHWAFLLNHVSGYALLRVQYLVPKSFGKGGGGLGLPRRKLGINFLPVLIVFTMHISTCFISFLNKVHFI